MSDLKHWDYADIFTAEEMAMLMIGLDPAIETHEAKKIKPVMDRISRGVDDMWWCLTIPLVESEFLDVELTGTELFPSLALAHYKGKDWVCVKKWVDDYSRNENDILSEKFDRDEIVRWLAVMGFDSIYDFSKSANLMKINPSSEVVIDRTREKPLHPRTETTYRNIIAALLEVITGDAPSISKHPDFENEAALISFISNKYGDYPGLSKRTLEGKFPEAKQSLKG